MASSPPGQPPGAVSDWLTAISRSVGFETKVVRRLGELLQQADCMDVVQQDIPAPVGCWGGQQGQLLAQDLLPAVLPLEAPAEGLGEPVTRFNEALEELARE
jgi:hypothetical protein